MAAIYRILNIATNAFYIGSTTNFAKRKWEHQHKLKKGVHHCAALQAAWAEHGADAFVFSVIEEVEDVTLLRWVEEVHLARWAGTADCYNSALSSIGSVAGLAEVRARISEALKDRYAQQVHPRLGTKHSAESRAKISAAKRANPVRPWLGKARAEETKRKISAAQKGVKKAPRVYTEEGLAKARANMARHAQKPVPLEFAAVLEKFPAEVQARYDFSEAVYTGALSRITGIKCSAHGEFSQYSAQLRKGRGCPACGALIRGAKKKQDMLERWADPATRETMLEARK